MILKVSYISTTPGFEDISKPRSPMGRGTPLGLPKNDFLEGPFLGPFLAPPFTGPWAPMVGAQIIQMQFFYFLGTLFGLMFDPVALEIMAPA